MKVKELRDVLQKLIDMKEDYDDMEIGLSVDMEKIHWMRTINRVDVRETEDPAVLRPIVVFAMQSAQEVIEIGKKEGAPVTFMEH